MEGISIQLRVLNYDFVGPFKFSTGQKWILAREDSFTKYISLGNTRQRPQQHVQHYL